MNNIVDNFEQILNFARSYSIPLSKKKGILREYLQTKILEFIYQNPVSINLFFIGGTSLRLLHGMDRFSEDLDFDIRKISSLQLDKLINNVYQRLIKENIEIDLYKNVTSKRTYYEFRFKNLLFPLKISNNKAEKLMVKFDFERFWQGQKREIILLKKYGFLINVVTVPLEQILVQKLFAYLHRKQTLPRDIYDVVWLFSREVKFDSTFLRKNKLSLDLITQAKEKFEKEKKQLKYFKLKLKPFLINESDVNKLDFFSQAI
ncbi:MAG TPA: nucleotidyl transferase AbiEii/AbiGii toxin family protein [Nevskiaceae bacterium]|nr:nucleotidyl transferase AbiEii/AbiGii toxin family protein [Nevskiaceae bacterium]